MSTEDGDVQEQGLVHDEITVDENVAPWDWWSEEPPEQDDNPGDVMPIENITEITEEEDDLPSYPSSWDDDPKDDFTEMTEDERRVLDTLHAAQSINRGPRSTEHITYTAAGQSSPPCAAATPLPPPSMALWRRGPS